MSDLERIAYWIKGMADAQQSDDLWHDYKHVLNAAETIADLERQLAEANLVIECFKEDRSAVTDKQIETIGSAAILWALEKRPCTLVEVARAALLEGGNE